MQLNSWNAYYYFFLTLLFLCFAVFSNISLHRRAYGETGYIEIFQLIFIVSVLIVGFVRKGYLIKVYSRSSYWLRQFFFSLLLYEEISFLTEGKFKFLDYNSQSQLNFHNSKFMEKSLTSFVLLNEDTIHLYPRLIISIFVIFFFFAGARISFFKRFRIISLHPLVSAGFLLYPVNLAFSYLIRNLLTFENSFYFVNSELVELLFYIIFLVDIVIKSYPRLIYNDSKWSKFWQ